jgi:hypothetical protein
VDNDRVNNGNCVHGSCPRCEDSTVCAVPCVCDPGYKRKRCQTLGGPDSESSSQQGYYVWTEKWGASDYLPGTQDDIHCLTGNFDGCKCSKYCADEVSSSTCESECGAYATNDMYHCQATCNRYNCNADDDECTGYCITQGDVLIPKAPFVKKPRITTKFS